MYIHSTDGFLLIENMNIYKLIVLLEIAFLVLNIHQI